MSADTPAVNAPRNAFEGYLDPARSTEGQSVSGLRCITPGGWLRIPQTVRKSSILDQRRPSTSEPHTSVFTHVRVVSKQPSTAPGHGHRMPSLFELYYDI